jgi:hypothetical protein
MNPCCEISGNAKIMQSQNPAISWRVICSYCGELLHVQVKEGSSNE